jgi:hypothetical protein
MSVQSQLSFSCLVKSSKNSILKKNANKLEECDSNVKMPVRSPLIQKQLQDPLVIEYIAQLSQMELVAFEVACTHLPMFNIRKCNGFRKWKNNM